MSDLHFLIEKWVNATLYLNNPVCSCGHVHHYPIYDAIRIKWRLARQISLYLDQCLETKGHA